MNKKLTKTLLKTAACLMLTFLFTNLLSSVVVVSAQAAPLTIFSVSPNGSDESGNGSLASPYRTISHGVALAPPGATLLVSPGTYNEMVNITQKVILKSRSSEPSDTVIDATGKSMGIMVMSPSTAGTVIEGFTVENANNHGIYVQDSSSVIIENNVVTHNGLSPTKAFSGEDKAIQLTGTSQSTVAGNKVVGNQFGGIAVTDDGPLNPGFYSPGSANAAVGNMISGNIVVSNRPAHCAIVVSAYNPNEGVINNIVSSNVVVDNSAGIIVAADTPNTMAVNNSVIFNTILNNGEGGVVIHSNAPGDVVTGTTVTGNTISGNGGANSSPMIPKFP